MQDSESPSHPRFYYRSRPAASSHINFYLSALDGELKTNEFNRLLYQLYLAFAFIQKSLTVYSLAMKTSAILILAMAVAPALALPIFELEPSHNAYVSFSPDRDGAN